MWRAAARKTTGGAATRFLHTVCVVSTIVYKGMVMPHSGQFYPTQGSAHGASVVVFISDFSTTDKSAVRRRILSLLGHNGDP